ncbi:MAG TPA: DUF2231 domain-containing protein [Phenylobacterium sp.]|nr:DUF2231 domain-containing protein [Phenylobacterium sp.]
MTDNPHSTARIAGHPLHPMFVPFPIVCFVLTLISDLAYWKTAAMQWANMSAWLLVVGLVMALLAVIAGLIDFLGERRIRALPAVYVHALGNTVALVLAIFNLLIHSRDAYTSVVPTGLVLSVLTVLILLVTGWLGGDMVYRHRVGVLPEDRP